MTTRNPMNPKRYNIFAHLDNCCTLSILADCALGEPGQERRFWRPDNGGHVYEVSEQRPGTLGIQVCDRLQHSGSALYCNSSGELADVIHAEARRALSRIER